MIGTAQETMSKMKVFSFFAPFPVEKCLAMIQVCTQTSKANKALSGILRSGVHTE